MSWSYTPWSKFFDVFEGFVSFDVSALVLYCLVFEQIVLFNKLSVCRTN